MFFRQFRALIATSMSVAILSSMGCQLCRDGMGFKRCKCESEQTACDEAGCPGSPFGCLNTKEKDPKKLRKDAKKDARINADGCNPEYERIPLLKRIADDDNQKSDIEVIKIAAKIKHEEEMCQQKIKAVKYLGTLGCKCYDKDGEVKKALLAALDDCLPAVRMAAVQAVGGCVCGKPYGASCCNEAIADRLWEMAYGTNKDGSYVEPDQNIRIWAAYVAQSCPKAGATVPGGEKLPEGSGNGPTPVEPQPVNGDSSADNSSADPFQQSSIDNAADHEISVASLPAETQQEYAESRWSRGYMLSQFRSSNAMVSTAAPSNSGAYVNYISDEGQVASTKTESRATAPASMKMVFKSPNTVSQVATTSSGIGFGRVSQSVGTDDAAFFPGDDFVAPMQLTATDVEKSFDDFDPFSEKKTAVKLADADVADARASAAAADSTSRAPFKSAKSSMTRDLSNMVALADQDPRELMAQESEAPATVDREVPNRLPAEPEVTAPRSNQHVPGTVQSVELTTETALIRLPKNTMVSEGARVHVVHRYALGRLQSVGEFEVLRSEGGMAQIRPVAGTSLRMIAVGDTANVY